MNELLSIIVNGSKVLIKRGILDYCGEFIIDEVKFSKALIISDRNVSRIYMDRLTKQLSDMNFKTDIYLIEDGEKSKNLATAEKIYDLLSSTLISRADLIIAIGGGVVTDIAGFVAATYKRGVNLINIPTSLLGMIDASIGGKNGVNTNFGKNLVGTFYQPKLVIIDPDILNTLPMDELRSGIAEAIKYGCISDRYLFSILEQGSLDENREEIISRCIIIKKKAVEDDPFDEGERMLLNFGHTIGHAIEKMYNYGTVSHGQAVSIGMNIMTKVSEMEGLTSKGTYKRLTLLCKKYNLPISVDVPIDMIYKTILNDKKALDDYINLIFIKEIGKSFIYKSKIDRFVEQMTKIC